MKKEKNRSSTGSRNRCLLNFSLSRRSFYISLRMLRSPYSPLFTSYERDKAGNWVSGQVLGVGYFCPQIGLDYRRLK